MSRTLIAPSLPRFLHQHRDMRIAVQAYDRPAECQLHAADILLSVGAMPSEKLLAHPLCPVRLVTCASREFVAVNGVPNDTFDLDPKHCIHVSSGSNVTAWEFRRGARRKDLAAASEMIFDDEASAVAAAVRSGGFVQVPQYEVDEALASGLLIEVLAQLSVTRMLTALVHHHASAEHARIQTFLRFLQTVLPHSGDPLNAERFAYRIHAREIPA